MFLELACVKFIPHVTRGDGEREGRQEERGGRKREVMEGGWLAGGVRSTSAGNNGDDNKTGGKPVRGGAEWTEPHTRHGPPQP